MTAYVRSDDIFSCTLNTFCPMIFDVDWIIDVMYFEVLK